MNLGCPLAEVMLPNAELVGVVFGAARTVWLKAFKNSARNWSFHLSDKEKFFNPEMFQICTPGALTPDSRVDRVTMLFAS